MWISASLLGLLIHGLICHAQRQDEVQIVLLDDKKADCMDEGIWILDGLVECSHLIKPSFWGLVPEAEYRCRSDKNTKCCQTCRKLGFSKSPEVVKPEVVTPRPTPAPPTQAPVTQDPQSGGDQSNAACVDRGVWIMDGLVDCFHLYTPSLWGLTSNARWHCMQDRNTDCCKTCAQLSFTRGTSGQIPETTPQATKAPSTPTPAAPTDPTCKDVSIYLADMDVPCKYLEQPSIYGVNSNPEFYCLKYPLTSCCHTCRKLGFFKDSNQNPKSTTTKKTTTTSTATSTTTTTMRPKNEIDLPKAGTHAGKLTNVN